MSVKRVVGVEVGVSFFNILFCVLFFFFFFFFTQILISRNFYQLCIVTIFSELKNVVELIFSHHPKQSLTFQARQSNNEGANFFSSLSPISAIEGHK